MAMSKVSELRSAEEVHRDRYKSDPEYAAEYDVLKVANDVAIAVLKYRVAKGWSQTRMAQHLGMKQPAVARLESAAHVPTVRTLTHLAARGVFETVQIDRRGARVSAAKVPAAGKRSSDRKPGVAV
jgi:ribosome-binding protein aMBF1 (putative translation factor)